MRGRNSTTLRSGLGVIRFLPIGFCGARSLRPEQFKPYCFLGIKRIKLAKRNTAASRHNTIQNLNCSYTFLLVLASNGIPFGVKLIPFGFTWLPRDANLSDGWCSLSSLDNSKQRPASRLHMGPNYEPPLTFQYVMAIGYRRV